MNTTKWLIRREFWENRAIWTIPAVFGGLLIVATLFGQISIPDVGTLKESDEFGEIFLVVVGLMFYLVMTLYAGWYLLDCLYADRKDRSILFWKSLPISDAKAVLSKALVGMVLIPLVYFVAADVTALIAAFILSIRARASIGSALWHPGVWWQIQVLWLYAVLTTAIWFLPVAGWLLLVSAWAKRAVMLWSILPPLALYIIERVFLSTHVVAHVLNKRLMGLPSVAYRGGWTKGSDVNLHSHLPSSVWTFIDAGGFFANVQTWIGAAAFGVALIVAAIEAAKAPRRSLIATALLGGSLLPRACPGAARADEFFLVRDENPLTRGFYVPLPSDSRSGAAASLSATLLIANTLNVEQRPQESLLVDGESDTLILAYGNALSASWRYRFTLPIIHDSGGFLDSSIDAWHRWFGLNPGNRPFYPKNEIVYAYSKGTVDIDVRQPQTSIGDAAGELGWYSDR